MMPEVVVVVFVSLCLAESSKRCATENKPFGAFWTASAPMCYEKEGQFRRHLLCTIS